MLVNITLHDIYFHFTPSFNIFHVLKNSRYDKTFVKTKLDEFFIIKNARKVKKRRNEANQILPHIQSALKFTPVEVCGEAFDEHTQADWHCWMSHSRGSRRIKSERKLAEEHRYRANKWMTCYWKWQSRRIMLKLEQRLTKRFIWIYLRELERPISY